MGNTSLKRLAHSKSARSIRACGLAICLVVYVLQFLAVNSANAQQHSGVSARSLPAAPYIEQQVTGQSVNFDLVLRNQTPSALVVVAVRLAVFDPSGNLVLERQINENGKPSAIDVIGSRELQANGVADLFQPFSSFSAVLPIHRMHFEVLLNHKDRPAVPIAIVSDELVQVDVFPRPAMSPAFQLPLCGHLLVEDGHDLYSHHRRQNLAARFLQDPGSAVNPNLFAVDLVKVDEKGRLFQGQAIEKEDWFSYGAAILAPADGIVVDAINNVPENVFQGQDVTRPAEAEQRDPQGFGNHVLLKHADGRVSWLLHMQPGSVRVKPGDHVLKGQPLGMVGFSGDSLFPHLHYNATQTSAFPSQGVPVSFMGFRRVPDSSEIGATGAPLETGEILDSVNCRKP